MSKFCENCGAENYDDADKCVCCEAQFEENIKNEDNIKYIFKLPLKYCGNTINKILILLHIKKRPILNFSNIEDYFNTIKIIESIMK